jgi:amino acid adenylation domain-containing protein
MLFAHEFVPFEDSGIEQSISARFEQLVARYPDRPAVVSKQQQFTYAELNQVANRIARAILAHLGKGEEPVALLFDHGAFNIAAILGILKAGKIYVSLDPAIPQARTREMLEDSQAKLLLTDAKRFGQARELTQGGQEILNCDELNPNIASENLDLPIGPEACALILYTSGSTGRPKGVLHNHRNILVETRNRTNALRICPEDRLALWHSCSFANSIRNLYGALLNGATVFPYDLAAEGFAPLAEWLDTYRITIVHTLATTFRAFIAALTPEATFPALRILQLGGEPIISEDVKHFQRRFSPHCVLVHVIGPTETFAIRRHFITHEWRSGEPKIPVGYAVRDKEVLLLDEMGRQVGPDQIGEIAVRSKYLALGYWRRPDLTEAVFLADPRGGDERLYLTGDLGIMRPDGCLIHMGRKDLQVKIRGHRVEVADIEGALLKLDSVKAAIVHAQPEDRGEQRLVAYVEPSAGRTPTVSELRRALAQALPDYMIPSAFVFLDALPLLPNGKIDRRALPTPGKIRPALETPYAAPRTPMESDLVRIWAEVLDLEEVGIHDDFLELGGHSLLATQILTRVIETFQVELPIQALLEKPTVAEMAKVIVLHQAAQADPATMERILAEVESLSNTVEQSPDGKAPLS